MESLHRFLDEDKDNGSWEMGVIIYWLFLIYNFHYGRGGGKVTQAWKHMHKWVKGEGGYRILLQLRLIWRQKGGSGFMLNLLLLYI